jgi:hypothetical protein
LCAIVTTLMTLAHSNVHPISCLDRVLGFCCCDDAMMWPPTTTRARPLLTVNDENNQPCGFILLWVYARVFDLSICHDTVVTHWLAFVAVTLRVAKSAFSLALSDVNDDNAAVVVAILSLSLAPSQ